MPDQRNYDRRRNVAPPGHKFTGVNNRRRGERRESPRAPMFFLLRDANQEGANWLEGQGNLSTGGILWSGKTPPNRRLVDLRFRLPGVPREFRVQGEIIRVGGHNGSSRFHVRFTELDVQSELAIARYLDEMFFDCTSP
jgi:hypothetical protein